MVSSRQRKLVAAVAALAVVAAGCSNSITMNSSGGGAPGVMSNQIDVGSIADVTGPLSSDFAPVVAGVQAYFSMVNAGGGVAGRRLRFGEVRSSDSHLPVANEKFAAAAASSTAAST